mgnify:CR=1 FL=1|nr:MAG TPA: Protein of unknown function (DUF454) [Caudoviricetes sp.]
MELYDLKLISEGCDADFLQTVNECCMNEAFGKSFIEAKKKEFGPEMKEAKKLLSEGKKLAKTDTKAAVAKFDEAIKVVENLKKEINKIEDDDVASAMFISMIRTIIPFIPTFIFAAIPGINAGVAYASLIASTISAYCYGFKSSSDLMKAADDPEYAKKVVMDYKNGKTKVVDWKAEEGGMKGFSRAEANTAANRLIEVIRKARDNAKKMGEKKQEEVEDKK